MLKFCSALYEDSYAIVLYSFPIQYLSGLWRHLMVLMQKNHNEPSETPVPTELGFFKWTRVFLSPVIRLICVLYNTLHVLESFDENCVCLIMSNSCRIL